MKRYCTVHACVCREGGGGRDMKGGKEGGRER